MPTVWYCIVAVMLAAYVVLDGFDIGAGIIHLLVARTDTERKQVIRAIGPVWDGNEVWLLAAGGALYCAFPQLYASSFSGFYLPLMMVLWLLMLRAIGIEFRAHISDPVWKSFFDGIFGLASILLAIFYGAALGNVIRGVPLRPDGYFFLPLFTNWRVGPAPGILDWYTVLAGVVALVTLAIHGANYIAVKTEGELQQRSRKVGFLLLPVLLIVTLLSLVATLSIRPEWLRNFKSLPLGYVIPVGVAACLAWMFVSYKQRNDRNAFLASAGYIVLMLVGAVYAVYPNVLPASTGAQFNLTIANSVSGAYGLKVALIWFSVGIVLALGYFTFVYRMFKGKVAVEGDEHGY
jgi:cytochrome d ubiquinol oxidase subunit II